MGASGASSCIHFLDFPLKGPPSCILFVDFLLWGLPSCILFVDVLSWEPLAPPFVFILSICCYGASLPVFILSIFCYGGLRRLLRRNWRLLLQVASRRQNQCVCKVSGPPGAKTIVFVRIRGLRAPKPLYL